MFRAIITVAISVMLASGCAMYKIEIQQGNIVTADMLAKLQAGQSKRQVEYIMGTPVLQDSFTKNMWIYSYRTERDTPDAKFYEVRVYFNDKGEYVRYEGDVVPIDVQNPEEAVDDSARYATEAPPAAAEPAKPGMPQ